MQEQQDANKDSFNDEPGLSEDAIDQLMKDVPAEVLRDSSEKETATFVTQSKFFSTAFNAAIFDGPIRIYFAQYQESQALKLYYNLQERYGDVRKNARGLFRERGTNIFVMLYPNEETFDQSFLNEIPVISGAGAQATARVHPLIACARLGADYVLGVRGQVEDEVFETLFQELDEIVRS